MANRLRLDMLLADRGLFPSRTAAARAIRAGEVRLTPDGSNDLKPSELVDSDSMPIVAERRRYVSRGGEKLANALDRLGLDPQDFDCLDIGASTGGFTDCLLQRGAARVAALDVAFGQLDDSLRRDPRVTEIPRANARGVTAEMLPFAPRLVTADVSFISLCKVLPAVESVLRDDGEVLAMVKPQFELGRRKVGRGGVVREPALRREAVYTVAMCGQKLGLVVEGFAPSGLPGPKGNLETFIHFSRDDAGPVDIEAMLDEVNP